MPRRCLLTFRTRTLQHMFTLNKPIPSHYPQLLRDHTRPVSRPSRSTVQVQLSVKRDGTPHLQSYHWSWCKPAVMRSGAEEASRPRPGRPSSDPKPTVDPTPSVSAPEPVHSPRPDNATTSRPNHETSSPSDPVLPSRPTRATRNPAPRYVDAVEILQ